PRANNGMVQSSSEGAVRYNSAKPLRVMKFGGTSVGDASCIAKVVEIVQAALPESDLVVVVSAMAGVTNKLIEAAEQSARGNLQAVQAIFQELRDQHDAAIRKLLPSPGQQRRIDDKMEVLFQEAERLCQGTSLLQELTPRVRDAVSSLGERLSAPIISAALMERGVSSESVEATELIVTDSYHGGADPRMNDTGERCEARLRPLLQRQIVPVVTGFIGATVDGVLTTLGRGGSDYSATILGAALHADDIVIWTDVDGLLTADPRLVAGASTVPEISYREAAELAYFGAKVLHPKTLSAVIECGIPVRVRNTFDPQKEGTRITPTGPSVGGGVKALAAVADAALIRVGGPALADATDVLGRVFATTSAIRVNVLLISQSSSRNDVCLVVSSSAADRTVEALRREFAHDLAHEKAEHIAVDQAIGIVAVVGHDMGNISGTVGRTFGALARENVEVIAIAHGSSECALSFVVKQRDMKKALVITHREFQLGASKAETLPAKPAPQPATWYQSDRPSANAD
ncbi:MAG TPA: aspartate kinase, partial [Terriglobales bacterium]|nr:aspartate kinase [Terriglobales bacterium]